MFFRPSRAGGGKRKRKARGQAPPSKQNAAQSGKQSGKAGKQAGAPPARGRRLDSAVPLLRPPTSQPAPQPAPSSRPMQTRPAERGAPLSDSTRWLLERMRRLKNLDDYAALKQPFIERYIRDARHNPGSAERAFYQAVGVCIRRILEERASDR